MQTSFFVWEMHSIRHGEFSLKEPLKRWKWILKSHMQMKYVLSFLSCKVGKVCKWTICFWLVMINSFRKEEVSSLNHDSFLWDEILRMTKDCREISVCTYYTYLRRKQRNVCELFRSKRANRSRLVNQKEVLVSFKDHFQLLPFNGSTHNIFGMRKSHLWTWSTCHGVRHSEIGIYSFKKIE